MYRKYDKEKRYTDRDALLHMLEINYEILKELKMINKTIKKGEQIKREPKKV